MANPYTLYYNDYSICSIMVRYTISLCERLRKDCPIQIEQRVIDIQHGGQLTEFYLCEVNPKGTVPVLTIPGAEAPLAESLDITYLLAQHYPFLIPRELSDEIKSLLAELHNINYFSLSYTHKPQRAEDMVSNIQKRLDDPDVSDRWRRALEYKLEMPSSRSAWTHSMASVMISSELAEAGLIPDKFPQCPSHTRARLDKRSRR
ncbi:hypothetical protein HRR80_006004 [Exophiala dermatitidis]|uniref:GST N-terminal domain-containing protein n=1 Tax=Exophiala dermatitidis TaxID=5970 RepID=A0AAN6ITM2_EXODE|nr:hypothetical protein HRR77_007845 [Exophiala dermatitidis]KAJ4544451.1 hypothetical protein HRR76_002510 [Exophiala dermatitidis]KAJ4557020.1 hypothetical protein HRR79_008656 [Exophiala dermatitidis]KAJ4565817.1 hypothetical protein HRR82_008811 [Exophiala dermatitidis]KAJ4606448.1 hypothetical protein HRR85_007523 [Exophiala dermatitidis]